jgi:hypothetical protein
MVPRYLGQCVVWKVENIVQKKVTSYLALPSLFIRSYLNKSFLEAAALHVRRAFILNIVLVAHTFSALHMDIVFGIAQLQIIRSSGMAQSGFEV